MPGFDSTGPRGMGPMTGGGRGFCAYPDGAGKPFFGGSGLHGWGGGRGWRNRFFATGHPRWQRGAFWNTPAAADDEKQALKCEAEFLRSRLQALEERLAAMQAKNQ